MVNIIVDTASRLYTFILYYRTSRILEYHYYQVVIISLRSAKEMRQVNAVNLIFTY